jgi:hypothetical protein
MLPFDSRDPKQTNGKQRIIDGKFPDYIRRLCDFRQMDFEATFDQLLTLASFEPQRVSVLFNFQFLLMQYLKYFLFQR